MGEGAGTLTRIIAAGILGGVVFLVLLGYRTDYVGHYLAGFGGTLGLLAFCLWGARRPLRWEPLGIAVVAVLLGAATEASVFRIAIFDPVDFCNQSLGAAFAAIGVQGRAPGPVVAFGSAVLAMAFVAVGAVFAFA